MAARFESATILLVEEDDQTRYPLLRNLRDQGYRVIVAIDEQSAKDITSFAHERLDLILINVVGKSLDEALRIGRTIRDAEKYDSIPLIVMAEKYGKDVEGTEVNVHGNDWFFYLGEESDQLISFIARMLSK